MLHKELIRDSKTEEEEWRMKWIGLWSGAMSTHMPRILGIKRKL